MSKIENYPYYDLLKRIYDSPEHRLVLHSGDPLIARCEEAHSSMDPESGERFDFFIGAYQKEGDLRLEITKTGLTAYQKFLQLVKEREIADARYNETRKASKQASIRSWIAIIISAITLLVSLIRHP